MEWNLLLIAVGLHLWFVWWVRGGCKPQGNKPKEETSEAHPPIIYLFFSFVSLFFHLFQNIPLLFILYSIIKEVLSPSEENKIDWNGKKWNGNQLFFFGQGVGCCANWLNLGLDGIHLNLSAAGAERVMGRSPVFSHPIPFNSLIIFLLIFSLSQLNWFILFYFKTNSNCSYSINYHKPNQLILKINFTYFINFSSAAFLLPSIYWFVCSFFKLDLV